MGWVVQGQPGSTKIWHNGDVSNFHSNMLLLPDQHIGIVVLINIGEFYNSSAINIPIEGVADILLGKSLAASTNPPLSIIPQAMMLVLLLLPTLWIGWSYRSIRRWQNRDEFPPRAISLFWRLYLPLFIDFCPVVLVWIILPAKFDAPMEIIALSVPDVFVVIVMLTMISVGWMIARIFLTLHPRHLTKYAVESKTQPHWITSEDRL